MQKRTRRWRKDWRSDPAALMARLVGHEPDPGLMVQGDVVRMHLHFSPDAF